jgi:hypothetical protein
MGKESNIKSDETPQAASLTREAIFQRLRDLGIEVTDVTEEMEGKTFITTSGKLKKSSEEK